MTTEVHLGDTLRLRREALGLLVRAVEDLKHEDGQDPTASQVRLRMGEVSYGGFSLSRVGFRRFRDLVDLAASEGLVVVDTRPVGDIRIAPLADANGTESPNLAFNSAIWRAMVDWRPDMLRVWDTREGRARFIPEHPVPLEPERFASVRNEILVSTDRFLQLPHLTFADQLQLLREFAAGEALTDDQKQLLDAALGSSRPIQRGLQLLRDLDESASRRWSDVLRTSVRQRLAAWAAETAGAPDPDELMEPVPAPEPTLPIEDAKRKPRDEAASVAALRAAVHRAVDSLSPEELRALQLPAGALFR